MPEISRFYGIKIAMIYDDHAPPHFHVYYCEHQAKVNIEDKKVAGTLPSRALKMVLEWASLHEKELMIDWDLAQQHKVLNTIDPLV